jgi:hypothetical protein
VCWESKLYAVLSRSGGLNHLAKHKNEVLEKQRVNALHPLHDHHQWLLGTFLLLSSFLLCNLQMMIYFS